MTDRIDDDIWVARCVACLVGLDPGLKPELALPVARDMSERDRWRAMGPEDAARTVFDFGAPTAPLGL
jgi:hypothetical protein